MDANMMKFAMDQMGKMSPEQLQAMMRSMPPDAMNQAMAHMKDMKPEDWEHAKQQMSSMDPDTLARQAAQAQAQMAGRTQYILNASTQLKNEGNHLHGRGAYREALEKYERAKTNVEPFTSKEARDLIRVCTLNMSSCYLNLKQFDKCLEQCSKVLSGEADNLKALYRRGQAYLGIGDCVNAAADLERALKLTLETDPSQAQPIREKLQEAEDQVDALRAAGKLPPAEASLGGREPATGGPAGAKASSPAGASTAAAAAPAASTSGSAPTSALMPGSGSGGHLTPNPEMLARATEMMRSNPDMLKQAQDMMRGMGDDDLRGMARQMGMDLDPALLRGGLGNLDPEVMAKVAQMQAELPPDLRGPDAARNPESMKRLADLMAQKPEMAATMGQMLSSMDPDKLQEMSRAAGLPAGVTITPELAKAAAESFKHMSPPEVQAAIETVSKMQQEQQLATATVASGETGSRDADAGTVSTSGREAASAATSSLLSGVPPVDPRAAAEMLAAMGPEELALLSKMVPGMDKVQLTPEMVKMAAEMMKDMTPEDVARMQQQMAAAMQGAGGGGAATAGATPTTSSASAAGSFPPDMAAAAAAMMKNMGPEDMARMQEMAAKMGPAAAAGRPAMGPGGSPDAAMASMFSDPKVMESAVRMLKVMDPEALTNIMMSSGMCKDRTQAEAMARQMSSLSDTHLRMMMKTASAVQSARAAGIRALAWARANVWLVMALIILLLALVLRWLGYM